jgi:polysaccharide chain length determinant protein (PEP-CTERM system associated)
VIPGKQYKPEDILQAAWRQRWIIVGPLVLFSIVTLTISSLLPDRYRSEATLLIVPQRVPETYVKGTVTARLDERLQSIGQQVLTRTQLERIIQEYNLYPNERKRLLMEDVIEVMKGDITIGRPGNRGGASSFPVTYESGDPRTAKVVTERLASLFIRQNLEDRSAFAEQTDRFLVSQLDEAREKLKDHESKLEQFRRVNPGRMPEEAQQIQQALTNAQSQLQSLQESMYRDRDRQLLLQRMIGDATSLMASPARAADLSAPAGTQSAARQLELARAALRDMQTKLRPEHPDIRAQARSIRDLEQKAAAEALQQPVTPSFATAENPAQAQAAARLSELQGEADALQRRLVSKAEDEKRLLAAITTYRQRIESVPGVQSRLTELMRDYATLQTQYQTLLNRSQEAKMASNMERREIGEQFKIIDPPLAASRPVSPNRPRLNLMGAALGLGLGLALAALIEYRDKSLRTEEDVVMVLALPVLALVPTMTTALERQKQRRLKLLVMASGLAGVALCVAAVAWKFNTIASWVR